MGDKYRDKISRSIGSVIMLSGLLGQSVTSSAQDGVYQPEITRHSDGSKTIVSTDPRGVVTSKEFNSYGLLASESSPGVGTTRYKYDEQLQLVRKDRADGMREKLSYDDYGRPTRSVMSQNGEDRIIQRFDWDHCDNGDGLLCSARYDDHLFEFRYDENSQVVRAASKLRGESGFDSVRYAYTEDGRVKRIRYPSGLVVRYHFGDGEKGPVTRVTATYSAEGEDRKVVIADKIKTDALGRIVEYLHGNGLKTKLVYLEDSTAIVRETVSNSLTVFEDRIYTFAESGALTNISDLSSGNNTKYEYDDWGRLISETSSGSDGQAVRTDYSLDSANNRTQKVRNGERSSYTYASDSNRMTHRGRAEVLYDAHGNVTEDRRGRRGFSYDATNRVRSFHKNGTLRATYDYDFAGRRVRKVLHSRRDDGQFDVRYAYNTTGHLLGEVGRRQDRSTIFARDYVWLGDLPLAQIERRVTDDGVTLTEAATSGRQRVQTTYLHSDHLGAPRLGRNEEGTPIWLWERDAYGAGLDGGLGEDTDPDGDGQKVRVPLRFPGQYHDAESGLYYNHHRDYDPRTGRYMQSDPFGLAGGWNRYAYAAANPVMLVDHQGLYPVCFSATSQYNQGRAAREGEDPSFGYGTQFTRSFEMCFEVPDNGAPPIPIPVPGTPAQPTPYTNPTPPPPEEEDTHEYEINVATSCNASQAFTLLRRPGVSAPGAPFAQEGTNTVTLTGNNPIRQTVNSSTRTIINQTLPGHSFHPGTVTIRVSSLGSAGSLINIVGTGTGPNPTRNNVIGYAFFAPAAASVSGLCLGITPPFTPQVGPGEQYQ